MSDDIKDEFLLWHIWKRSGVNLNELKNEWTYVDLLKAKAVLDMYDDYDAAYSEHDTMKIEGKK